MATRELIIGVSVDRSGRGRRALGEISGSVRRAGDAARAAGPAFGSMARSVAGMAAGAVAFRQISGFAQESIGLFGQQEAAVNALNTALSNQGVAVDAISGQYQEMASRLQGLTTAGDETIIEMQALLTSLGEVGPEQMEAALTASLNLAEGMGRDLLGSAQAVAKAFQGKTEVLAELGIELDRTAGAADLGTQAIDALNERFGGRAAAAAETYNGQIQQLNNSWGDLKEAIGEVLVPLIQQLLPAIQRGIEFFQGLSPEVQRMVVIGGGLTAALTALAPIIATVGLAIGALSAPVLAIGAAIVGLTTIWLTWGDDIKRITGETVTAVREWLVGRLGAIFDSVKEKVDAVTGFFQGMFDSVVGGSIIPDLVDGIGMHFGRLDQVMVAPARQALSNLTGMFQGWADNLGGMMSGVFGTGGLLSGIMTGGMSTIMTSLGGLAMKGLSAIGGAFKRLFGGPSAKELAGREIVENFQANIATMLDEQQNIESGGVLWKQVNIGVRDSYKEVGLSEQEALNDLQRLYDAIKGGPDEVNPIIAQITAKMDGLGDSINDAVSAFGRLGRAASVVPVAPTVPSFQTGGVMPHTGLAMLHKGERVIPATGRGGATTITMNVSVGGFVSDPTALQAFAKQINTETLRQFQMIRQLR